MKFAETGSVLNAEHHRELRDRHEAEKIPVLEHFGSDNDQKCSLVSEVYEIMKAHTYHWFKEKLLHE